MSEEASLKQIKKFIETYSPRAYSIILAAPVGVLILGFIIWNIYLYSFGSIEDEILRAKFILSGFTFCVISYFLWRIAKFIVNIFSILLNKVIKYKEKEKTGERGFRLIHALIALIWIFFYTLFIFPVIPVIFGGGQPRSLSLIATAESMSVLNSLEIQKGIGADYQTENLCIVHENSHAVYILREDRILSLDRSLFQGLGSLPGIKSFHEQQCIEYAYAWSVQGTFFSIILVFINIVNKTKEVFSSFIKSYN